MSIIIRSFAQNIITEYGNVKNAFRNGRCQNVETDVLRVGNACR